MTIPRKPTDEQQDVIDYNGNIVVTANPGSGKTYTIVEKINKILPDLPDFKGVIAISFTNKASDELKQRCRKYNVDTKMSFFGTIDKFYISQIIIPFASHITNINPKYKIQDDLTHLDKYNILDTHKESFTNSDYNLILEGLREGLIFLKYIGETALYIIEKVPEVIVYLKARYSYIIIDEYQDCGIIQDYIFRKLVKNGIKGIAVGDINQAIFGFSNRSSKYLISLIKREDFQHFILSKNHRCHNSISEYSLCLFNASKEIPNEKRVFKVNVIGNECEIANVIDKNISKIKEKYKVVNNNQVAILCRNNQTIDIIHESIKTPCKIFIDTPLDTDESDKGRFFKNLLLSRFDKNVYVVDFVEQYFSREFESKKYYKALALCKDIFSCPLKELANMENKMVSLAELAYPGKNNDNSLINLKAVISNEEMLENYIPAQDREINLMTLHKSKGLEFNIVFHLNMNKWIMPNEYNGEEGKKQDLNLHYVGITRAIDVCYLVYGTKRYQKRNDAYTDAEPSPFFDLPGLNKRRKDVKWN